MSEKPGGRGGFGGTPKALSAREALEMATRGGAAILGRDDIGYLAPGMSADFIAVKLNQLGLSGTQRDPLAALVMCGPFRVDYSFINGKEIIRKGEFRAFDVEAAMADHAGVMERIYAERLMNDLFGGGTSACNRPAEKAALDQWYCIEAVAGYRRRPRRQPPARHRSRHPSR